MTIRALRRDSEASVHPAVVCALALAVGCAGPTLAPEPPDPAAQAAALELEAQTRVDRGDLAEAVRLYEAAVTAREREPDPDSQALAETIERVATLYEVLGRRDRAAPAYERAIETRSALRQPSGSDALLLHGLAVIQHQRGHPAEAEHFYRRALAALDAEADDPALRARTHTQLGALYAAGQQLERAEPELARALEILESAHAPDDPALAPPLVRLAGVQLERGRLDAAGSSLERAVDLLEGSEPPERRALAFALSGLADIALQRDRVADAVVLFERSVALLEEHEPRPSRELGATLANLGALYARLDRHAEAALLLEGAAAELGVVGDADVAIARVLFQAGSSYARLGRGPEASSRFERSLAIRERVLDPHHPDLARSLDALGAMLLDEGRYARARSLLERAVAIHERGVTQPVEFGASLSYLGRVYAAQYDTDQARPTLERALALLEPALGRLDPLTLATRAGFENASGPSPASPAP